MEKLFIENEANKIIRSSGTYVLLKFTIQMASPGASRLLDDPVVIQGQPVHTKHDFGLHDAVLGTPGAI